MSETGEELCPTLEAPLTEEALTDDASGVTRDLMRELVQLRKRRKMGQEPIAKAMGMTQSRVSQMENLRGNMTLESVILYAKTIQAKIVIVPDDEEPGKSKKTGRTSF